MFEITWIQNGAVCSMRTHSADEATEIAVAARTHYAMLSLTYTDSAV